MKGNEELHAEERRDQERASSLDGSPAGNGQPAPQDRDAAPQQAESLAPGSKSTETPRLNKWQTFWRGVVHVDMAKMEPWIGLRNAFGVVAPLAVGIAIGMPLGGLAVASGFTAPWWPGRSMHW
jgi:hypothetical protein